MHRWSDDDNLIAYCLYRFGKEAFHVPYEEIGGLLGMGLNSLNLKIANFKFIDGAGGLEGYSEQALQIHRRYSELPDAEVLEAGSNALNHAIEHIDHRGTDAHRGPSPQELQRQLAKAEALVQRLEKQLGQTRK